MAMITIMTMPTTPTMTAVATATPPRRRPSTAILIEAATISPLQTRLGLPNNWRL
jgi:hypothetical protein